MATAAAIYVVHLPSHLQLDQLSTIPHTSSCVQHSPPFVPNSPPRLCRNTACACLLACLLLTHLKGHAVAADLGGGVAAVGALGLLDVVTAAPATVAQRVRLIATLTEASSTLACCCSSSQSVNERRSHEETTTKTTTDSNIRGYKNKNNTNKTIIASFSPERLQQRVLTQEEFRFVAPLRKQQQSIPTRSARRTLLWVLTSQASPLSNDQGPIDDYISLHAGYLRPRCQRKRQHSHSHSFDTATRRRTVMHSLLHFQLQLPSRVSRSTLTHNYAFTTSAPLQSSPSQGNVGANANTVALFDDEAPIHQATGTTTTTNSTRKLHEPLPEKNRRV